MWKKLVLMGGLFACLGLPVLAAADAPPGAQKAVPVELKGKLQMRIYNLEEVPLQDGPFHPFPGPIQRGPVTSWTLLSGGTTYTLDFDNRHDLWVAAEQAVGQTILVNGMLDAGVVHVATLKPDPEHAWKTVNVEVKGRLQWVTARTVVPLQQPGNGGPFLNLGSIWELNVNDKVYTLDLGGAADLPSRGQGLVGRSVIVTGVLQDNEVIRVASLAPSDEHLKVTQTTIDLKGKLQYVITKGNTDAVVMVADQLPEDMADCWVVNFGLVIDGQTYILDFSGAAGLRTDAQRLVGGTVLTSGVLDGVRVKVNQLSPEHPELELAVPL